MNRRQREYAEAREEAAREDYFVERYLLYRKTYGHTTARHLARAAALLR